MQFDPAVAVNFSLYLVDIGNFIITNSSDTDDKQTDVLAIFREGLETLHRKGLVLSRANNTHAQKSDWLLCCANLSNRGSTIFELLKQGEVCGLYIWSAYEDDLAMGRPIKLLLSPAD
jgi:hypothetical protein